MEHPEYLMRRDELVKIRTDSFISFDRAVLSLATGGLALSVTFLDKIGAPFNKSSYFLIIATWLSLFVVILANLLSYHFAKANMWEKIQELDDRYKRELEQSTPTPIDPPRKPDVEKQFWQRKATDICNDTAFYAFFVGIAFFTVYIIQIQMNNYNKTVVQQPKEESVMSLKKTAGLTEVSAPVAKQPSIGPLNNGLTEVRAPITQRIREGQTEVPAAVSRMQSGTRGQTEIPQAVVAPAKPAAQPAIQAQTPAAPPVSSPGIAKE